MGAYESTPVAVQSEEGLHEEKVPSGYFGVTISGEPLIQPIEKKENFELEQKIKDALEKAFEQGKQDGIKSSREMIAHIVDAETEKLRKDMADINTKYKGKMKDMVTDLEKRFPAASSVQTKPCLDEAALLKMKYGVAVWKCRHPDVTEYIARFLANTRLLAEQGLLEKIFINTVDKDGNYLNQIEIKILFGMEKTSLSLSPMAEEDFRSFVLKLFLIDINTLPFPHDGNWSLMSSTITLPSDAEVGALRSTLASGEWVIDNDRSPENIGKALDQTTQAVDTGLRASSSAGFIGRSVAPLKSVRNEFADISAVVYSYNR